MAMAQGGVAGGDDSQAADVVRFSLAVQRRVMAFRTAAHAETIEYITQAVSIDHDLAVVVRTFIDNGAILADTDALPRCYTKFRRLPFKLQLQILGALGIPCVAPQFAEPQGGGHCFFII